MCDTAAVPPSREHVLLGRPHTTIDQPFVPVLHTTPIIIIKHQQVEDINREMAEVFGLAFAPDASCLGPSPSSTAASDAMFGAGASAGSETAAAAGPSASQQLQQLKQEFAAEVAELRSAAQERALMAAHEQLQQQVEMLQQTVMQLLQAQQQQQQPSQQQHHQQQQHAQPSPPPPPLSQQQQQQLSHVDASGRASMVDVAGKASSGREARASCRVLLGEAAFKAVAANAIAKGDVLRVAQIAGIQGAKATAQLIPLCHNIFISSVNVDLTLDEAAHAVHISATARAAGQTGVEMEALTGAAVAALTVYDMTKAVSKGVRITELQLDYKEGGKSGVWRRELA